MSDFLVSFIVDADNLGRVLDYVDANTKEITGLKVLRKDKPQKLLHHPPPQKITQMPQYRTVVSVITDLIKEKTQVSIGEIKIAVVQAGYSSHSCQCAVSKGIKTGLFKRIGIRKDAQYLLAKKSHEVSI